MGTTSEKLTYLNVTKQKLKQAINNIGGEVTDETTFRNYVAELENAYDRLPKTEFEEGESVTLENTLKGKLDFQDGKVGFGQASQDSTQGYQLINNPNFADVTNNSVTVHRNTDGSYTLTGTSTGLAVVKLSQALTLDNGVPYYVSGGINENIGIDIRDNSLNSYGTRSTSPTTIGSYTPSSSMSDMYVCVRVPSGTATNVTIYPMISKSNTYNWEKYTGGQASPNPSYPQTINSVTGNQDVVVSGKNYFKYDTNELYTTGQNGGYILQSGIDNNYIDVTQKNNGYYVNSYNNTGYRWYSVKVDLPKNKQLKFVCGDTNISGVSNIRIYGFNSLSSWQAGTEIVQLGNGTSFNTGNYNYYLLGFYPYQQGRYLYDIMIIDNDITDLTYEPYITPTTYQLSLGDIELNAIGNYKDELIYDVENDKVYKNEKIGKKIFTGASDENWAIWQGIVLIDDTSIKNLGTSNTNLLLNYFQASTNIAFIGSNTGQRLHIQLSNAGLSEITSVSAWRTWLSTHNLEFVYVCNETQTEITDTTLKAQVKALYNAHSLNGTTIITSNGDLPMIIKVRGLKGE